MRSVHALRQTTGMIRMYWATIEGSKRFVFVLSLSVLPTKTCSTETKSANTSNYSFFISKDSKRCLLFDLVPPLALHFKGSICIPIQAARHLKRLDVLSSSHAAGALSDDARQTHLLLQVNLSFPKSQSVTTAYSWRRSPADFNYSDLNPRVLVMVGWCPRIDDALVIESRQIGAPTLKAKNTVVYGGCWNLRLHNGAPLHAQQRGASWDKG